MIKRSRKTLNEIIHFLQARNSRASFEFSDKAKNMEQNDCEEKDFKSIVCLAMKNNDAATLTSKQRKDIATNCGVDVKLVNSYYQNTKKFLNNETNNSATDKKRSMTEQTTMVDSKKQKKSGKKEQTSIESPVKKPSWIESWKPLWLEHEKLPENWVATKMDIDGEGEKYYFKSKEAKQYMPIKVAKMELRKILGQRPHKEIATTLTELDAFEFEADKKYKVSRSESQNTLHKDQHQQRDKEMNIEELNEQNKQLNDQLRELKECKRSENNQLNEKIEELNKENERLKNLTAEYQKDKKTLNEQITALNNKEKDREAQIKTLNAEKKKYLDYIKLVNSGSAVFINE